MVVGAGGLAALDRRDVLIVAAEAPARVSLGLYHDDETVVGFERSDQAAFDHLAACLWSETDRHVRSLQCADLISGWHS